MTVTVIVALYNGERFIIEQLESIKNQERKPDEVIIADDGSKDDGPRLVKEFIDANNLTNWRLIINKTNKGWQKNFISNASVASGDYIFFSDQDDLWRKDKIRLMISTMEANPMINLLCGDNDFICYDGYEESFDAKDASRMRNDGSLEKVEYTNENYHIQRPGCSMCIRKSFFKSIEPLWKEKWGHDDFCWKFALLSDSCYYLHSLLITRRRHATNTARNEGKREHRNIDGRLKQLHETEEQYNSLVEYAEIHVQNEEVKRFIKHNSDAINIRIMFLETKNPLLWMKLATKYRDTYPRWKGLFLDFCIVYLGERICQKF